MLSETAKKRFKTLRQEHNPLVYLVRGGPQQIEEISKTEALKDIPAIPEKYVTYYIDHMVRGQMIANWEGRLDKREPEIHRHECEDFTFPDGMEYPVWLLDIRMKSRHEANRKRK